MKAKETVSNFYWTAVCRMRGWQEKAAGLFEGKVKGASHFVEIVVAIIIVVALGLVFKTQITTFITTITNKATTEATNLF